MSWGDDPDLQAQVRHLRNLLEQLEVGILWGYDERRDARLLTEWLYDYCRLRSRPAVAAPDAATTEQERSGNRSQGR